MFNNKFLKNDPLLEAVKAAQADGTMRRKAEALVNEEFGVYSRNAVIRENLAAYDARLEEAYKSMKEGNVTTDAFGTKMTNAGHPNVYHDSESTSYKASAERMKSGEKAYNPHGGLNEKKMWEGKKLADKDYDKDGKVESPKDEVWGSRLRAAKMAGKLKEEEQIDEISKSLAVKAHLKRQAKSARAFYGNEEDEFDHKSYDQKATESGERIKKKFGQKTFNKTDKIANKVWSGDKVGKISEGKKSWEEETDYSAQDRAPVTKSAPKEDPSLPKSYPGAASSAPTAQRLSNAKAAVTPIKEDEQLDELTRPKNYQTVQKVNDRADEHDFDYDSSYTRSNRLYRWTKKNYPSKRDTRNQKPTGKTELGDYSHEKNLKRTGGIKKDGVMKKWSQNQLKKDVKGRLGRHTKPNLPEGYELEEAKYSAKAARAGADIGKPGKMFSKIAAKAGEKYGSEERGKKVAGAILKKIRAKHMKEDQSFNSALETGKTVDEAAVDMYSPPAIERPANTTRAPQAQRTTVRAPTFSQGASQAGVNVKPTVTTSGKFGMQQGMSQAGREASKLVKPPVPIDRIAYQATQKGASILPKVAKIAGGPVVSAAITAMTPTPANKGENEFARQAKVQSGNPYKASGRSISQYEKDTLTTKNTPSTAARPATPSNELNPATTGTPSKMGAYNSRVGPSASKFSTGTPAAAPAAPAAPSVKQSFSQAFRAAREAGGSKAQFEFGGKKFQAAATNKEYVPTSQQKPVDTAPKVPTPPERPKDLAGTNTSPEPTNRLKMSKETKGVNEEEKNKTLPDFKGDIKSGGPMASSMTSKDFAKHPPSSLKEEVTVGDNKYRIV